MNHVGSSARRKVRCTRTRTRAIPPPTRRRAGDTDARQCASISIRRRILMHLDRRPKPVSRTSRGDDGVEAPSGTALLARMLQFGDSMFPIGGFSFSSGLESAIQKGVVADAITLRAFTRTAVQQAARGGGMALIPAHPAATGGGVGGLLRIHTPAQPGK